MEGFPSGQREQTVNLSAQPSEVRILPPPPQLFCFAKKEISTGGNSSIGRASAFQAEGCEFETRFPLHYYYLVLQELAHVAQLVERILGKDEVTGSIPVVGSMVTPVAILEQLFNGLRRQENVEEKI
jgi:hypothetical protein